MDSRNRTEVILDQGTPIEWLAEAELGSYEKVHLGETLKLNSVWAQLRGYIGTAPIALSGAAAAKAVGADQQTWDALANENKRFWLIKNVFGVERIGGVLEPGAVGLELTYRDDARGVNPRQSVHIHSLFPSAEFRKIGEAGVNVGANANARFSARLDPFGSLSPVPQEAAVPPATPLAKGIELDAAAGLTATATTKMSLDISVSLFTPVVQAMGVGDTEARWLFYRGNEPLIGKDIPTWTGIIVSSDKTSISYEARMYVVFKVGRFQLRRHSEWRSLGCEFEA